MEAQMIKYWHRERKHMEIKEGYIHWKQYQTYYRIANPQGKKTPLCILHGGPGSTHNSYEVFDHVALEDDRPILLYDQLGCGLSSLEGEHKTLWRKDVWVEELIEIRKQLHLDQLHLMGHSWGGMLAIIYLCDYEVEGIQSLILSSTLSSASLWRDETHRLLSLLPADVQKDILYGEEKGCYNSLEYTLAVKRYMQAFVGGPWGKDDPECLTREKKTGREAYVTAWGESEFSPTGTLRKYEYTDSLHKIKCPVLLTSGANDESTPLQNKVMLENIVTEKKWVLFAKSRHMSYVEEHELYVKELLAFLHEHD